MDKNQSIETLEINLADYTREDLLSSAMNCAFDMDLPIAIWRMPDQSEITLIIGVDGLKTLEKVDLEELPSGFVCAPFNYGESKAQFISSQFSLSFDFNEVVGSIDFDQDSDSENLKRLKENFLNQLDKSAPAKQYHHNPREVSQRRPDYRELVQKSIDSIINGQFDKVVPARTKSIKLSEEFKPIDLFLKLNESYPKAFISLVSLPNHGTWIGASPETLIEKSGNHFRTVALAGTQRFNPEKSIGETAWTQKEIEEQAMVSRFIVDCFKKIRLREFKEAGPKTQKAGNLLHLKTTFQVDTKATNFPELATIMLNLLHPTSAVAGMPKEPALDFLNKHEGLERGLFSGFLGPVNIDDQSNLFVNLRCMQLLEQEALLYAGAGVTADSSPDKEFHETEIKFNTLLNILNRVD